MGIGFLNERNFREQTKFFRKMGVVQEKTDDGRTKWLVQRNEKIFVF